jgi:tyrosyl-tRNA synthetase
VAMKMSKSDPRSAVFVHDSPDEIRDKVRRAFCPPGQVDYNPVLDWTRHLVFGARQMPLPITGRDGGVTEFRDYDELAASYSSEHVHPVDLKNAVADCLIDLLEPARKHFEQPLPRNGLERVERALTSAVDG